MDTSAWIDYLQERDTEAAGLLGEVLDRGYTFGITSTIYQELLQGAASEEDLGGLMSTCVPSVFIIPAIR